MRPGFQGPVRPRARGRGGALSLGEMAELRATRPTTTARCCDAADNVLHDTASPGPAGSQAGMCRLMLELNHSTQ